MLWGGYHGLLLALERARGKRSLWAGLPRPAQVAATFLLVNLSWVLFRASDLPAAGRLMGAMVGLVPAAAGARLLDGILYQPYYLLTFGVAGLVAFAAPQTWDWTRRLPAWKIAICLTLLWLALAVLNTQAYNPFIYFIF